MDLIVHETWLHQGRFGGMLCTLKLDGEFSVDILVVLSYIKLQFKHYTFVAGKEIPWHSHPLLPLYIWLKKFLHLW